MLEFSLVCKRTYAGSYDGNCYCIEIKLNGIAFGGIFINSWAMGCCGVATLTSMSVLKHLSQEEITSFFDWLAAQSNFCPGYNPKEYLFTLSNPQIPSLEALVTHPNVKHIDSFANKSHGPNMLHIYRYSVAKDFK